MRSLRRSTKPDHARRLLQGLLTAGALALCGAGLPPPAAEAASIAIVVDGSGSMWGRLAGSNAPKFKSASAGLLDALNSVPAGTRIGLVTFGQRARGGCDAANVILPSMAYKDETMRLALNSLNPQGRGPLVLGLRRAAETLDGEKAPRRIIVVHDDPDNCSQDVCAVARELKGKYRDLQIFALSLAPKPNNRGALACLAKETGGRVIEVSTAAETATALTTLIRLASLDGAARPARTARPASRQPQSSAAPAIPPQPRPARASTPGLMLSAVLAPNRAPLREGLLWTVTRRDGDAVEVVAKTTQAAPSLALPPGSYQVELRLDAQNRKQAVTVAKGPRTPLQLDLASATLTLAAVLAEGGTFVDDAVFEVRASKPAADQPADIVWSGLAPQTPLVLAAGTYQVSVSAGNVVRRKQVELARGGHLDLAVPLQAGYVTIKPRRPNGSVPAGVVIAIEVDDPASPSGRSVVARSLQPNPSFLLPAGTYYATARLGDAVIREQSAVAAGKIVEQTITIPIMRLRVVSKLRGGRGGITSDLRYRIWKLRAPQSPPIVSDQPSPLFELAPGPYRIEGRIGQQNAVIVRDFEVTAAKAGRLTLEHDAGSITLSLRGNARIDDVYWEIRDQRGNTVWRALGKPPKVTLKAGSYTVIAEVAGQSAEGPVTIESGRHLEIELGLN